MRFTITLRNILLMSTIAAFIPLVAADYHIPYILYPTPGATLTAGETTRIVWEYYAQPSDQNGITGNIYLCSDAPEPQCSDGIDAQLVDGVTISNRLIAAKIPEGFSGKGFYFTFMIHLDSGILFTVPLGEARDLTIN